MLNSMHSVDSWGKFFLIDMRASSKVSSISVDVVDALAAADASEANRAVAISIHGLVVHSEALEGSIVMGDVLSVL